MQYFFLSKGKVLAVLQALHWEERVVAVLAALRDVAHDAEQGLDEVGCEDKTNVTTKSGLAARLRRRQLVRWRPWPAARGVGRQQRN